MTAGETLIMGERGGGCCSICSRYCSLVSVAHVCCRRIGAAKLGFVTWV
jgi:hypothetical protein